MSPPNLEGEYALAISAADCGPGFPAEFRTRRYGARIDQDRDAITITLDGPTLDRGSVSFYRNEHYRQILSGVILADGRVAVTTYIGSDQSAPIADEVTQSEFLLVYLEARLNASPNGLSGPFTGAFEIFAPEPRRWVPGPRCVSQGHSFDLSR